MISIAEGDILRTDAEALVNYGQLRSATMGRGIALQFKRAFPDNFKAYESACRRHEVQPGSMFVFSTGQLTNPRYVINFRPSGTGAAPADWLTSMLVWSPWPKEVERLRIKTIAIPPLGCGLGGLRWEDVRPLIERTFRRLAERRSSSLRAVGPARHNRHDERQGSAEPDARSGRAHRAHRAVPGRLDGSFRLSVGGPQADVLRSGGGREAETSLS